MNSNPSIDINIDGQDLAQGPAAESPNAQYALVARAIDYIRAHALEQPSLETVAAHVGLSEYHFQRLFAQWAGVSPKRFLQYLTKEHAKLALRGTADVLEASLAVGLSTPSRLHDLIVTCEAMTPGEVRSMGAGVTIGHGRAQTPFGAALIGWTARGVCYFEFCDGNDDDAGDANGNANANANTDASLASLKRYWREARFTREDARAAQIARTIFPGPGMPAPGRLHLVLRGTNFQIKVWEALLRTAPSDMLSYAQLAAAAGVPGAARAVGSAMAANPIGYLIPCHRVIRGDGDLNNYRWGLTRKAALLAWECASRSAAFPISPASPPASTPSASSA